jgi:hypothetical protein
MAQLIEPKKPGTLDASNIDSHNLGTTRRKVQDWVEEWTALSTFSTAGAKCSWARPASRDGLIFKRAGSMGLSYSPHHFFSGVVAKGRMLSKPPGIIVSRLVTILPALQCLKRLTSYGKLGAMLSRVGQRESCRPFG